jgi:SAM-dependent methyltransferase
VESTEAFAPTVASYDLIAEGYERQTASVSAEYANFRTDYLSALGGRGTIADLGCGPGRDALYFLQAGLAVIGVDASREMTRRARAKGVRVAVGDLRAVPLRGSALDGVWSSASLLHVPREEVPATLRSWVLCLRTGGILGLSTSLGEDEGWEKTPYDPTTYPHDVPLRRWYVHHDRAVLLNMLELAGVEILSTRERVSHRRWLMVLARRRGRNAGSLHVRLQCLLGYPASRWSTSARPVAGADALTRTAAMVGTASWALWWPATFDS